MRGGCLLLRRYPSLLSDDSDSRIACFSARKTTLRERNIMTKEVSDGNCLTNYVRVRPVQVEGGVPRKYATTL